MKSSLIVVAFFCIGCLVGIFNDFQFDMHNLSMYILYALMLQVGISIGSNKNLKFLIKSLRPNMLLVPIATIVGTLLFSAFASLLLSQWSVFDCMAVGSGFAYYSLSSILITQFKEASVGLQLATELGTIALLANIFREMMALLGAPLIRKYFGKLAPISAAGVNSMDVLLPSITLYSGKAMIPVAIFHGILIDMSVPSFVSLFCSLSSYFFINYLPAINLDNDRDVVIEGYFNGEIMVMLKINIGISAYKFTNKILIIADCTSFVGNSQPRFSILFQPHYIEVGNQRI